VNAPADHRASRRLRVLVADESADACETLRLLFEMHGYEVRCASDGAAAIEAALEFAPDVCVLDIGMPRKTGYAVACDLRALYGQRCPYLIAVSGQWFKAAEQMLMRSGVFDRFVQKPVDQRELLAVVRRVAQARLRHSESSASHRLTS
jgi:CheY-like chemotaxis protein